MAKLRKFCAYRRIERPYTRVSKFRAKSYVRTRPASKVIKYVMGNPRREFPFQITVISKTALQIRHNAIESARQSANRVLEKDLGKNGYFFRINIFPHHILRENPLAAGAGADRMSTGMKMSFGKPIGIAAQVKKGQTIVTIGVDKAGVELAKKAAKRVIYKIPTSCSIVVNENPIVVKENPSAS